MICDYERRRAFNESMNIEALRLLDDGTIDFLVIPQDDSAPYGYTAISQKRVISELKRHELDMRCMIIRAQTRCRCRCSRVHIMRPAGTDRGVGRFSLRFSVRKSYPCTRTVR